MEKLELRPPKRHAVLAGGSETLGGALLAVGASRRSPRWHGTVGR